MTVSKRHGNGQDQRYAKCSQHGFALRSTTMDSLTLAHRKTRPTVVSRWYFEGPKR
jgi:hypothetical protein